MPDMTEHRSNTAIGIGIPLIALIPFSIIGVTLVMEEVGVFAGAIFMGIGYFLIDSHAKLTIDSCFKITAASALVVTVCAFLIEGELAAIAFLFLFAVMSVPGVLFVFPALSFTVRKYKSPTKAKLFAWASLVVFAVCSLLFNMYQEMLEEPRKKAKQLTSTLIASYQRNPESFRQNPAEPVRLALTDVYGSTTAPFTALHGHGGDVVVAVGNEGVTVAYKNIPPGRFCRDFIRYRFIGFDPIKKGFIYKCQSDEPVTLEFFSTFEAMGDI